MHRLVLAMAAGLAACASGPEPVVQPARYLVAPAPVYPAASRRNQESGSVTLRVQIRADDSVGFIDVKTGSLEFDSSELLRPVDLNEIKDLELKFLDSL